MACFTQTLTSMGHPLLFKQLIVTTLFSSPPLRSLYGESPLNNNSKTSSEHLKMCKPCNYLHVWVQGIVT